jgi:hypothetical protein
MRESKLYANVFCAPEIPVLGCYASKSGVQADPEKISSIYSWSTPKNQTELGDDEGRERVVRYQSRQMKSAEKNYPVHDKELLAMRYALIKFRVYLLGEQTFAVCTDHASLRTAMKSPHLSQRMARWLLFFAEYNFVVHYKPDKNNSLVDALSRRPDYDPHRETRHQELPEDDDDDYATCITLDINATVSSPVLPLRQQIADAYYDNDFYAGIICHLLEPTPETLAKLTR